MQTTVKHKFKVGDLVGHKSNLRFKFRILGIIFNGNKGEEICYMCVNVDSLGMTHKSIFSEGELMP